MVGSGDNHQFLIIACQLFKSIFTEIAGVCLFTMDKKDGAAYFIAECKERGVEERKRRGFIPALVGIKRAFMIAAWCFVISVVIFHELRGVIGQWVDYAAGKGITAVAIVFRTLRVQLLAQFVTLLGSHAVKIAFRSCAAYVVHRRGHGSFDARVDGCGIDGKSAPAANPDKPDTFRIHVGECAKVIHCCTEIFRIDVGRCHIARFAAAFTGK